MAAGPGSMAQLNVRMDPAIKSAGDEVLERANVTPTQFVRAIWAKLSQGSEALDQLIEVLLRHPSSAEPTCAPTPMAGDLLAGGIVRRQEELEQSLGLDISSYRALSEDEMRDLLLDERIEREHERMVWND